MKNFKNAVCGILILIGFFLMVGIAGWYENHYTLQGKVVDNLNGEISVECGNGKIWKFTADSEDYPLNIEVELTMFTNYTTQIKDDEIIKIKIK